MSESKLPPHRKVHVDLGARGYDVVIGRGLLDHLELLFQIRSIGMTGSRMVVQDKNVPEQLVLLVLNADPLKVAGVIRVTPGEPTKSFTNKRRLKELTAVLTKWHSELQVVLKDEKRLESSLRMFAEDLKILVSEHEEKTLTDYEQILSLLAQAKVSRSGLLIAIGGGVTGDLAGFAAATYLRGIAFVQVPTTLLAMVDSSVGGKTGVNLPEGKNLVGAFHQPKLVVADLDTLATLPAREFAAGMAEVIKYGAIRDVALFERVARGVKPGDADLDEIVEKCVAIKARIVENDEFETKGERALLNFGHTIGHAIEKATGYTTYLHGEAISLGMRAAAWLSERAAGLAQESARDIEVALIANQLPVVLKPEVDSRAILDALGNDKKVAADGCNRWVLLPELGKAESGKVISPEMVAQAVEYLRTHPDDL